MRSATHRVVAPEVVRFTMPTGDADTHQVRAILRTHIAHESTRSLRQSFVHLLAALGGFVIVCMLFPALISDDTRRAVVGIWVLCALSAVGAAVVEWRLRRREARLLTDDPESCSDE